MPPGVNGQVWFWIDFSCPVTAALIIHQVNLVICSRKLPRALSVGHDRHMPSVWLCDE